MANYEAQTTAYGEGTPEPQARVPLLIQRLGGQVELLTDLSKKFEVRIAALDGGLSEPHPPPKNGQIRPCRSGHSGALDDLNDRLSEVIERFQGVASRLDAQI